MPQTIWVSADGDLTPEHHVGSHQYIAMDVARVPAAALKQAQAECFKAGFRGKVSVAECVKGLSDYINAATDDHRIIVCSILQRALDASDEDPVPSIEAALKVMRGIE